MLLPHVTLKLFWHLSYVNNIAHCNNWPLVHTSVCLIFSIKSKSKFSRNSTLVFESFIRLSMLVTSASVYPAHSVIISWIKSILGFGTAVKSILFGTISSRADAKLISDNGFLSDFPNRLSSFFGLATRGIFFYHVVQNPLYQSLSL